MVAGGVGLAPFATLDRSARRARHADDAVLRRAQRARAVLSRLVRSRGVRLVLTTEDGSTGERGRVTVPLERELQHADGRTRHGYACGRSRCSKPWRTSRQNTGGRRRCRSSA